MGTFPKKNSQGPPKRNFHSKNFKPKFQPKPQEEDPSGVNKFQRKANFNRNQEKEGWDYEKKNQKPVREFRRKEEGQEFDHNGQLKKAGSNPKPWQRKRNPKFEDRKPTKNPPVKGTSTEYAQLANSDESDDDIPDVDDMLDGEIPLLNSSTRAAKTQKVKEVKKSEAKVEKVKPEVKEESDSDDNQDEEEQEESEDEDEEERLKFREEMANMPIGKVREMKEKLGIKLFNKTYFGVSEDEKKKKLEKKKELEKEDRGQHRPREISSKRPVSSFRNIYGEHEKSAKVKKWDPRFDSRAGDYKEVCFENNYQFLDDIRKDEIEELRQQYNTARAEGDEFTANRVKNTLQKMETREKTRAEKRRQTETRKELHDENIQRMLRGEAPVFKTKAAVRKIDMEKKYEALKKDNKLDKYLEKKSKKESAKLKKARPPFEGYGF